MRDLLLQAFTQTLASLRTRVDDGTWRCCGAAIDHAAHGGDVLAIAFGKAARAMAHSLRTALPPDRLRGLCVPPAPDDAPLPPFEVIAGGHPLPTAGSFAAAARALELCHRATSRDHVVFLVSGGGSALLELPLDTAVPVAAWRSFYQALVHSGAPIGFVNRIRRRLSAVKGGRLAMAAQHACGQTTVVLKDVPGPVEDVASGPTACFAAEPDTLAHDLAHLALVDQVPPPLHELLRIGAMPPLPELPARVRSGASWLTVADEYFARAEIVARLQDRGFVVTTDIDVDDWLLDDAVEHLLRQLDAQRNAHPTGPIAIVTTGELSVALPADAGCGGRNQQFALACARRIAGTAIAVMSCGTDGIDGNSPAAGAIVDGTTMARAQAAGLDGHEHLRRFDAFPLLHAIDDTVITGPTGTNVRDVRVLMHRG